MRADLKSVDAGEEYLNICIYIFLYLSRYFTCFVF